jgi:hypothetical protein
MALVEHIGLGIVPRPIGFACGALGLQRREEALHRCIVTAMTRPAHRAGDAMIGHQPLELLAGVLAATIRVVQQRAGISAPPDCHHQGISDELPPHGQSYVVPRISALCASGPKASIAIIANAAKKATDPSATPYP